MEKLPVSAGRSGLNRQGWRRCFKGKRPLARVAMSTGRNRVVGDEGVCRRRHDHVLNRPTLLAIGVRSHQIGVGLSRRKDAQHHGVSPAEC